MPPPAAHVPSWWTVFWMMIGACGFYLATLQYSDRTFAESPSPPLTDVGYMLVPETIWTQAFCDISAFSFLVPLALTILYKRRYDTFRYAFYDIAIGKAFSATLHAVTIMPESRTHLGGGLPGFLCGGATDRLMSNHVYEVGIGLELWERVGWSPLSWHGRIAVLATYSLLLISSRGHYTVDVVLAWWALAAVHRLGRGGYGPELCEEAALTESQRAFQRAKTIAKRAETERRFGAAGGAEQKAL